MRLSDIYWSIQEILDWSVFLEAPQNRVLSELRERLSPGQFLQLLHRAKKNKGVSGFWKLEIPIGEVNQVLTCFYTIKSKIYASLTYIENKDGGSTTFLKKTMKGGILRARSKALTLEDYFAMGDINAPPTLQENMPRLVSKNWTVYFTHLSRYNPTIFDRKKVLVDPVSGLTCPIGFLENNE